MKRLQSRAAALAAALALAGQVQAAPKGVDPKTPVMAANAAARVQPALDTFQGAVQKFAWSEGGLYHVYASPGRVTDLVLQPGEQLAGPGPIAAGDTARWILGDTESGVGADRRVHVLVKPTAGNLSTNLIINTDRRTYYVELRAHPTIFMASVAWTYPQGSLIAVSKPAMPASPTPAPTVAGGVDLADLSFAYTIGGDRPPWRPTQVFDDGHKTYVVFPAGIAESDMPPLFLVEGGRVELVNYRIRGRQMIVDRLFEHAELRLGDKRRMRRVKISRVGQARQ